MFIVLRTERRYYTRGKSKILFNKMFHLHIKLNHTKKSKATKYIVILVMLLLFENIYIAGKVKQKTPMAFCNNNKIKIYFCYYQFCFFLQLIVYL